MFNGDCLEWSRLQAAFTAHQAAWNIFRGGRFLSDELVSSVLGKWRARGPSTPIGPPFYFLFHEDQTPGFRSSGIWLFSCGEQREKRVLLPWSTDSAQSWRV